MTANDKPTVIQTRQWFFTELTRLQRALDNHYREPYHHRGFWSGCPVCNTIRRAKEEVKKQLSQSLARDKDCLPV